MKTLANIASRFREEEEGAAMIEYAILVGIISVASIAVVIGIGTWVHNQFSNLCDGLQVTTGTGATATTNNCAPA